MAAGEHNESNTLYAIWRYRVYSYKPADSWWCSGVLSDNKMGI